MKPEGDVADSPTTREAWRLAQMTIKVFLRSETKGSAKIIKKIKVAIFFLWFNPIAKLLP
jgi:hypothetical protein